MGQKNVNTIRQYYSNTKEWCGTHPLYSMIIVAIIVLVFGNNTVIPDIMESRNLVTAREMVNDGNWIIPTMNGNLRLEKPPLPTWIAAVTEMTIGEQWWAMRLIPALAGVLLLFFFYRFCEVISKRTVEVMRCNKYLPFISSLILLTCYNFTLASKTVTWDIYCHAFQLGGIYYMYRMITNIGSLWHNAILAGILTGLSIMSKGPVSPFALLIPFFIAIYVLRGYIPAFHQGGKNKIAPWLTVIVIALIIGGWWYLFVYLFQTDTGIATLDKESTAWTNRNVKPWYYYWSFFTETGIWIPLCIASLFLALWRKKLRGAEEDNYEGIYRYSWLIGIVWTLAILFVLSLMPEKKNRYLLPILIPSSLMMGSTVCYLIDKGHKWLKAVLKIVVGLFVVVALFGMGLLKGLIVNAQYTAPAPIMSYTKLNDIDIRKTYPDIPAYWTEGEEMRIELIYDMGRKVKEINVLDSTTMQRIIRPSLLMVCTSLNADSLHIGDIPNKKLLGTFDGNRFALRHNMYKPNFIYNLYLLNK